VVPAYSYWDSAIGTYRLRYEPALELVRTEDEEADVRANTRLCNQALEAAIRRFPDQWFWVHRRWRNRPPGEQPLYPDERKEMLRAGRSHGSTTMPGDTVTGESHDTARSE
jgi:hypothetical protein